ncbi:hypothetical protein Lesp01_08270 [Lentzea sp. NBRC 102530]|nr:hypothetical protein Lesp01_08270 [Lentzea sp. NBRC 102530]
MFIDSATWLKMSFGGAPSGVFTVREPLSKSWNEMYGCVPLPFIAPTANSLAELCIVSLRMVPNGKSPSNVVNGTSAIGSVRPAFVIESFAVLMLLVMSGPVPVGPLTPMTNTMSLASGPASRVMASMTVLTLVFGSFSCVWLTIMLTTNEGGLPPSTLSLSLAR